MPIFSNEHKRLLLTLSEFFWNFKKKIIKRGVLKASQLWYVQFWSLHSIIFGFEEWEWIIFYRKLASIFIFYLLLDISRPSLWGRKSCALFNVYKKKSMLNEKLQNEIGNDRLRYHKKSFNNMSDNHHLSAVIIYTFDIFVNIYRS